MQRTLLFFVLLVLFPVAAHAGFQTVALPSAELNYNTSFISLGLHGDQILGTGNIPIDIPDSGNNAWYSQNAAASDSAQVTLEIPVGVYGAGTVYTLINTHWGQVTPLATVKFYIGDVVAHSVDLAGNTHIRDWNPGNYTNSIDPAYAEKILDGSGSRRLDMQTFVLPGSFSTATLSKIELFDYGARNTSRTFITGLTVETAEAQVPVPAAAWLLGSGLVGLFSLRRRRNP